MYVFLRFGPKNFRDSPPLESKHFDFPEIKLFIFCNLQYRVGLCKVYLVRYNSSIWMDEIQLKQ